MPDIEMSDFNTAKIAFHRDMRRKDLEEKAREEEEIRKKEEEEEALRLEEEEALYLPGVTRPKTPKAKRGGGDQEEEEDDEDDFPEMPENAFRAWCWRLVTHNQFDNFIMLVIVLNVLSVVASIMYPNGLVSDLLEMFEYLFTAIYIFEAILKVTAFGFPDYWSSDWNKFDFSLVVLSVVDMGLTLATSGGVLPVPPTLGRALRLIRVIVRIVRVVMRVVRLWHMAQVKAAASGAGLEKSTRVIKKVTRKNTLLLSAGDDAWEEDDDDGLLDCGEDGDVEVAEHTRDQWTKARIKRSHAANGRVSVHLALPGRTDPVAPAEMQSLFTWKADEGDDSPILSFRAVVMQPRNFQTPVKLEVLRTSSLGRVFTYYENGALTMDRWSAHEEAEEAGQPGATVDSSDDDEDDEEQPLSFPGRSPMSPMRSSRSNTFEI